MKKKNFCSGYFTVEAALIMPMVLLFVTVMLFVAFYVYDRSMLEHCAYEAALRGSSSLYKTNEEAYQAAENAAISLVENKIFAVNELKYEVVVTGSEISVAYRCTVNVPLFGWFKEYVPGADFNISAQGRAPRVRAVKTIRLMDRVLG